MQIPSTDFIFKNNLPFLILIYFQSFGIDDSETLMLVLDNREIQQNHKESWFPKLQNVLVVTKSNKNIADVISHIDK